ncbi:MAG: Uncharacterised protein [Opitutia bacterium UBA7350]|nr:MAG: Uncharacterised protein [Opitutae bacterium UBA7350]
MKLSKLTSLSLIVVCLSPFALLAEGQDFDRKEKGGDPSERQARIQKMDANGDGVISREEAEVAGNAERAQRMFDHLDGDGDGNITRDEMRAGRERFAGKGGPRSKQSEDGHCPSCQK